uniref:Uncharacterized protein n=1 Tax=Salix viminalis TaxID=40686 RepID=A0A6N2N803_SALVM
MSFAGPDRPREVRMEAAYFLQQLCQSSSLTLQMLIACRGIPILVGFLEADHAKYRLVNTLYSLNEATRLASISVGTDARYLGTDTDGPQSSNETIEVVVSSKLPDPAAIGKATNMGIKEPAGIVSKEQDTLDQWKSDPSRLEIEFRQPRVTGSTQRTSTDRPPKLIESASNGLASVVSAQSEQVCPLLSISPVSWKVSGRGRENGNLDSMPRISHKTVGKKVGAVAPKEGAASTSGIVSQTASGVLSGSGVLNARPGSATSSGLLSQMVSAEVAREYLEKVADLLLEFSQADTSVKSYMCSQSLLNRLFQMFNRIEIPILLKRADAIKYLIPNLELKDGPLVDHIHSERTIRAHGGLDVYLSLLDDMVWSVTALDSIAVCLAHDNDKHKVEQALLKKDAVQKKSSRINTTLAVNGLTPLLIARLDHQDAIARLNLLKLIEVKFATPYCPVLTFSSALRNYKL